MSNLTPEEYDKIVLQAWVNSLMEKDRTLIALSAGGVGLLTTLLATVGPTSKMNLGFYIAAGVAFLVTMASGLAVFTRNASYLRDILTTAIAGKDAQLQWLDRVVLWSFWFGVVLTGTVAVSAGIAQLVGAK